MSYGNSHYGHAGYTYVPTIPTSQPPYGSQPGSASYPPPPQHSPYPSNMNHGYPPQQGYGAPQGHSPYPPQQGYGAPPVPQHPGHSPYQQQGFAPPSGPPPGQYGAPPGPPPGQYGAPPGPPPGQYGAPQGHYGAPQGQYGAPQGQYGAPAGPPPGQYGAPPQGQYGAPAGPPNPPSLGYVPGQVAPMDLSREADQVRAAMKGFGTDEKLLIAVMSRLDPLQAAGVKQTFQQRHRRDLLNDLEKETSGYFRDGLLAIARGPLEQDCFNLNKAIKGLGTKENVLNDVLLSRSNADINAIKTHYQHMYRRSLEADLKGDLSMKTERLFNMILAARRNEDSTPVIPQQIDADIQEMYRATEGQKMGTDQITVCSILSNRSDGQIRAISLGYKQKYHRSLGEVIKKNFSGHMEDALVFMLEHAEDRAKHDASLLEDAMKGMGTKDDLLVNRTVRVHWDKARMGQARAAYKHFYKQNLTDRIKGETRGDYERLMVALVESGQ